MIFTIGFFRIFNNFCREKKFPLVGIGIHYCSLLIWITSSFYQQNKCSFFFFLQWIIVKVIRQPGMRTQNTHIGQKSIAFNRIGPFDLKNKKKNDFYNSKFFACKLLNSWLITNWAAKLLWALSLRFVYVRSGICLLIPKAYYLIVVAILLLLRWTSFNWHRWHCLSSMEAPLRCHVKIDCVQVGCSMVAFHRFPWIEKLTSQKYTYQPK